VKNERDSGRALHLTSLDLAEFHLTLSFTQCDVLAVGASGSTDAPHPTLAWPVQQCDNLCHHSEVEN